MRTFVMGDIHGAYKALVQCLFRARFDYEKDVLIQLGDAVDGCSQASECVDELLKIRNLVAVKGNHDDWFDEFIKTGFQPYYWNYGGKETLISYLEHSGKSGQLFLRGSGYKTGLVPDDIPYTHRIFFDTQHIFHIDSQNRCFVHGGFDRLLPFDKQNTTKFYWDRNLWNDAMTHQANGEHYNIVTPFKEIYIGHSPTQQWGVDFPLKAFNIFNIDTGAGNFGRLTIMNVDTKEFWQSDPITELYNKLGR